LAETHHHLAPGLMPHNGLNESPRNSAIKLLLGR
jgi:hypothetical protein